MLILAFDTATDIATSALVEDDLVLGERTSLPRTVLEDADALLRDAGAPGSVPVVDARRREVFVAGPRALGPDELELEPGSVCVGNGAVRYRAVLEARGAIVPPDDDEVHLPRAWLHASLARDYGAADDVVPIYVRKPDVELSA
jgi:tRNA threonylcarbamoyladenosine biosynthesis protein TsaB